METSYLELNQNWWMLSSERHLKNISILSMWKLCPQSTIKAEDVMQHIVIHFQGLNQINIAAFFIIWLCFWMCYCWKQNRDSSSNNHSSISILLLFTGVIHWNCFSHYGKPIGSETGTWITTALYGWLGRRKDLEHNGYLSVGPWVGPSVSQYSFSDLKWGTIAGPDVSRSLSPLLLGDVPGAFPVVVPWVHQFPP